MIQIILGVIFIVFGILIVVFGWNAVIFVGTDAFKIIGGILVFLGLLLSLYPYVRQCVIQYITQQWIWNSLISVLPFFLLFVLYLIIIALKE